MKRIFYLSPLIAINPVINLLCNEIPLCLPATEKGNKNN